MSDPVSGVEYIFFFELVDLSNPNFFLINPPIVEGDFKRSLNGAALANFTNLPEVTPPNSTWVKAVLTAAEMPLGNVNWQGKDQSTAQWQDIGDSISVPNGNTDTILDIIEGDHIETNISLGRHAHARGTLLSVPSRDDTCYTTPAIHRRNRTPCPHRAPTSRIAHWG